jgi:hypothetical protein
LLISSDTIKDIIEILGREGIYNLFEKIHYKKQIDRFPYL